MIYGQFTAGRIRTQCRCVCDCGNEIVTVADRLTLGCKTSCGCDTTERKVMANRKDLTGQRFGRLVVQKMLWEYKPTKCECICDCGNTVTVISTGLTSGKTNSCGCYQRDITSKSNTKDWTGMVSQHGVKFIKPSRKRDPGQWLWLCECGFCGGAFEVLPAYVMNGSVASCGCIRMSNGELMIREYLEEHAIAYVSQYSFKECKNKHVLKFDFAVFDNDELILLIEYDGAQHFRPVDMFGGVQSFEERQKCDQIKNNFCATNGYRLLRLPYTLSPEEMRQQLDLYLSVETAVSA